MVEPAAVSPAEALIEFHPLIALAFGTLVGLLAQSISSRLRHNGQWKHMPPGRKWALGSTGALAAYGVGLWILGHPAHSDQPYVYRLWFWQLAAAWGGTAVLDGMLQAILSNIKGGDQESKRKKQDEEEREKDEEGGGDESG